MRGEVMSLVQGARVDRTASTLVSLMESGASKEPGFGAAFAIFTDL